MGARLRVLLPLVLVVGLLAGSAGIAGTAAAKKREVVFVSTVILGDPEAPDSVLLYGVIAPPAVRCRASAVNQNGPIAAAAVSCKGSKDAPKKPRAKLVVAAQDAAENTLDVCSQVRKVRRKAEVVLSCAVDFGGGPLTRVANAPGAAAALLRAARDR